jgi:methylsterol monooxygenase
MLNSTSIHDSSAAVYAAAGTDFSKLNWFELQWAAIYIWLGNPIFATGVMSFVMHEVVYFGRCIPWIIIDAMPYFRKWKLQPVRFSLLLHAVSAVLIALSAG